MTAAQFLSELTQKIREEVKRFAEENEIPYFLAWRYVRVKYRGKELESQDIAKIVLMKR